MRGINKYDKNINLFGLKLTSTFNKNGDPPHIVPILLKGGPGNVYVATYDGGLYEFNHRTSQVHQMPVRLNGKTRAAAHHHGGAYGA
jgi:hypothetical protein